MKIRAKLALSLFGIGAVFALSLATMAFGLFRSLSLRGTERLALSTVAAGRGVDAAANNLLIGTYGLPVLQKQWSASIDELDVAMAELEKAVRGIGDGELLQDTVNALNLWKRISSGFKQGEEIIATIQSGPYREVVEAKGVVVAYAVLQAQFGNDADGLYDISRLIDFRRVAAQFLPDLLGRLEDIRSQVSDISGAFESRSAILGGVAVIVGLALGLLFALVFSGSLSRRIRDIEVAMSRVASRDLTVTLSDASKDELGDLSRHVVETLGVVGEFIVQVRGASEAVSAIKDELSSGSVQAASSLSQIAANVSSVKSQLTKLDQRVDDSGSRVLEIISSITALNGFVNVQSDGVDRVASSIEEMDGSLKSVAKLAADHRQRATDLSGAVAENGETISRADEEMRGIASDVDRIGEVVEIIESVAEQTNLLAMNAAIEAAHAGDAGRGFAVVADEIRKLADSAAENARAISSVLGAITGRIDGARDASSAAAAAFEAIKDEVTSFVGAMSEVAAAMSELSQVSGEVLTATSAMADATKSIKANTEAMDADASVVGEGMEELNAVTDQVVGAMGEIASGADELVATVHSLSDLAVKSRERAEALEQEVACFTVAGCDDGEAPDSAGGVPQDGADA